MSIIPRITDCQCGQCKLANIFADMMESGDAEYALSRADDIRAIRESAEFAETSDAQFGVLSMETAMMVAGKIIKERPDMEAVIRKMDADALILVGEKMQRETATLH